MQSFKTNILLLIITVFGLIILDLCSFTLHESKKAALFKFGNPVGEVTEPGFHFKNPLYNVSYVEKRAFLYDSTPRRVITSDKKHVVVDEFALCKITNATKFLQAVKSKQGGLSRADDTIFSKVREIIGKKTYDQIVKVERENILETITKKSDTAMKSYFMSAILVRVNRVDLPEKNKEAAYNRMKAERNRKAQGYISRGEEEAREKTSDADRMVSEIIATAEKESKTIRGKADGKAAGIYNTAYGKNPDFFSLYRGLETAKSTLGNKSNSNVRFILKGDELFLKYLLQ